MQEVLGDLSWSLGAGGAAQPVLPEPTLPVRCGKIGDGRRRFALLRSVDKAILDRPIRSIFVFWVRERRPNRQPLLGGGKGHGACSGFQTGQVSFAIGGGFQNRSSNFAKLVIRCRLWQFGSNFIEDLCHKLHCFRPKGWPAKFPMIQVFDN
jgi:hypothetical protein